MIYIHACCWIHDHSSNYLLNRLCGAKHLGGEGDISRDVKKTDATDAVGRVALTVPRLNCNFQVQTGSLNDLRSPQQCIVSRAYAGWYYPWFSRMIIHEKPSVIRTDGICADDADDGHPGDASSGRGRKRRVQVWRRCTALSDRLLYALGPLMFVDFLCFIYS